MRSNGCKDIACDFCTILSFLQGATFVHVLLAKPTSSLALPMRRGNDNDGSDGNRRQCHPPGALLMLLCLYPFGRIHWVILIDGFPLMHRTRLLSLLNQDNANGVTTTDDINGSNGGKIDLRSLH